MLNGNGHNGYLGNLWPGHYCPTCGGVVKPGALYESATIAPEPGKKGDPILLKSLNSRLAVENPQDPSRIGWCFHCNEWVRTKRKTTTDVRFEYAHRLGVRFRFSDSIIEATSDKRAQRISNLIEVRAEEGRMGAGVLRSTVKRKR